MTASELVFRCPDCTCDLRRQQSAGRGRCPACGRPWLATDLPEAWAQERRMQRGILATLWIPVVAAAGAVTVASTRWLLTVGVDRALDFLSSPPVMGC
ncbi:MAG: hypothetical protein HKO59_02155 [Phycisphaerales bacterium]|nr:hypothetical protein [Phycisphaerae bacterium]NNF42146.1 hypothetical protein [Phycisphaerales bacterium]NNM24785.1 hypothetical protein [Phycisphaerales bacterium]